MARKESPVQKIVRLTAKRFPSFGGGKISMGNPLSHVLRNDYPTFAAGVDIELVIRFVLAKHNAIKNAQRPKIGDDARDYMNHAYLLTSMSDQHLEDLSYLKRREMRKLLRSRIYPFHSLHPKDIERLVHLPTAWIYGAASYLQYVRKRKGSKNRINVDRCL